MISSANGKCINEIQQDVEQATVQDGRKDEIPLDIQGVVSDEKKQQNANTYFLTALHDRARSLKLGIFPSTRQFTEEQDEISPLVPSTDQSSSSGRVSFIRKVDWASLWKLSKDWIKNPVNIAFLIWFMCVAISSSILSMVMTGMLNGVLPTKSQRDAWFEASNQILNALFTLMCLYHHPKRLYHLVLLVQWRPNDVLQLQKIYCKNGTCKPNERVHMMAVVAILNLNCFAQYALYGLNIGYTREKRPVIGLFLLISVAIVTSAFSFVYTKLSPLGREYGTNNVQEPQYRPAKLEEKYLLAESNPQWIGGLFDWKDDVSIACMSVFCSCCVFGWNMERLGFGNMYVHIVTFFLFCVAPFFIFNLAAINIDNGEVRVALEVAGVLLCVFGLLYGGFWRSQMRKRFRLPEYSFCCGSPLVADCFQWLFCCSFALAQEVRTANYYDIVEEKFFLKQGNGGGNFRVSPLRDEDALTLFRTSSPSNSMRESSVAKPQDRFIARSPFPVMEEDEFVTISIELLKPPASPLISREAGSMR